MPDTSMVNIQANPSMRRLNSSPYCGAQDATKRTTSPPAIRRESAAASSVDASATEPASEDATLREREGKNAAHTLAMNGKATIRQRSIASRLLQARAEYRDVRIE